MLVGEPSLRVNFFGGAFARARLPRDAVTALRLCNFNTVKFSLLEDEKCWQCWDIFKTYHTSCVLLLSRLQHRPLLQAVSP